MRRSGREGGKSYQKNVDENWSFRPLHDHNIYQEEIQSDPISSTEHSTSSSAKPISDFIPKTPKSHRKKSELGSLNFHPKPGEDNGDGDGNKGKAESLQEGKEQNKKKESSEGFGANKDDVQEDDEDDVVKRLERLRLFGEEPDLSEELLSINDQLQEDEVNFILFSLIKFDWY